MAACVVCAAQGTTRLMFRIATRGLLGVKNALLTATRGMGIVNTLFDSYQPVSAQRAGNTLHACYGRDLLALTLKYEHPL